MVAHHIVLQCVWRVGPIFQWWVECVGQMLCWSASSCSFDFSARSSKQFTIFPKQHGQACHQPCLLSVQSSVFALSCCGKHHDKKHSRRKGFISSDFKIKHWTRKCKRNALACPVFIPSVSLERSNLFLYAKTKIFQFTRAKWGYLL